MNATQWTRYLYIFLMFTFSSFSQVISTDSDEFSTTKDEKPSFLETLVGFIENFNSNLHLASLGG